MRLRTFMISNEAGLFSKLNLIPTKNENNIFLEPYDIKNNDFNRRPTKQREKRMHLKTHKNLNEIKKKTDKTTIFVIPFTLLGFITNT